ncbi:hypothetical protein K2173_024120 [Erythroxylum novogranatense]|uniref:HTH three-helical bundle domain-containing protein n=1 Tax=Erythroxylum novogranatense TaxID=1862640 RepID=A0AAV8UG14_9ROSI|nr:hypothetical protein K2173_024120 [Erythroxylum novogranatense]
MEKFPSANELTVASALLLLSTSSSLSSSSTSFSASSPLKLGFDHELSKSNFNSSMSSTSSSLITNNQASSKPTPHRKIRIVTVVSRRREMKFQVARRRRTEVCWSYDHRKVVDALPIAESSASTSTEGSCLSSSSSARRECMSRSGRRQVESAFGSGSVHIRRRAEAIMKLLSRGCFSEVEIRQVLGDSPDTSKALRMLLKLEEIKRTGTGGRQDPYIYSI